MCSRKDYPASDSRGRKPPGILKDAAVWPTFGKLDTVPATSHDAASDPAVLFLAGPLEKRWHPGSSSRSALPAPWAPCKEIQDQGTAWTHPCWCQWMGLFSRCGPPTFLCVPRETVGDIQLDSFIPAEQSPKSCTAQLLFITQTSVGWTQTPSLFLCSCSWSLFREAVNSRSLTFHRHVGGIPRQVSSPTTTDAALAYIVPTAGWKSAGRWRAAEASSAHVIYAGSWEMPRGACK